MLINNAGVVQGKSLLDLSSEDVQQYVPSAYLILQLKPPGLLASMSWLTFGP